MLLLPSTTHLLLGTSSGTLNLADTKTCQILKSTSLIPTTNSTSNTLIDSKQKTKMSSELPFSAITNLQLVPKPYDLNSTSTSTSSNEASLNSANGLGCNVPAQPLRPLPLNLDRILRVEGDNLDDYLPVRIEEFKEIGGVAFSDGMKGLEGLRETFRMDEFQESERKIAGSEKVQDPKSQEKQIEIDCLRDQLEEAKKLNEEMWKKLVESQEKGKGREMNLGEGDVDVAVEMGDQEKVTKTKSGESKSKSKKGKKRKSGDE